MYLTAKRAGPNLESVLAAFIVAYIISPDIPGLSMNFAYFSGFVILISALTRHVDCARFSSTQLICICGFTSVGMIGLFSGTNVDLWQGISSSLNLIYSFSVALVVLAYIKKLDNLERVISSLTTAALVICLLGWAQVSQLIVFHNARSYVTTGYDLIGSNHLRMTSIFNEPSSLAYFLGITTFFAFFQKKTLTVVFFLCTLLATQSLFAVIFCLFFFIYTFFFIEKKNVAVLCILILIIFPIIFLNDFIYVATQVLLDRIINGAYGEYRSLAPLFALREWFNDPLRLWFGFGVGQTSQVLAKYPLPELPNTTHWLVSDLLLEVGIVGLLFYILFFTILTKAKKVGIFSLFFIVMIGFGWRSTTVTLIIIFLRAILEYASTKIVNFKGSTLEEASSEASTAFTVVR
jgi:hypothetical protein